VLGDTLVRTVVRCFNMWTLVRTPLRAYTNVLHRKN